MNFKLYKNNMDKYCQFLFILLIFFLPISISITNILVAAISFLWLLEGNFKSKFEIWRKNPILIAFLLFFALFLIGILWSENTNWALKVMKKEWKLIAIIIFITITKQKYIKYYIYTFILSMFISAIASIALTFRLLPNFILALKQNPVHDSTSFFISHISYTPLLALAIYLLFYMIFIRENNFTKIKKSFLTLAILIMIFNLFTTIGRAGQVMFLLLIIVANFSYFKASFFKAFISSILSIVILFGLAYTFSPSFKYKVNRAYIESHQYTKHANKSISLRINYIINSLHIIKNNPIFGVGTGDFPKEYRKMNHKLTPNFLSIKQPHNMYLYTLVLFGIFGFIFLINIFITQIYITIKSNSIYKNIQFTFTLFFLALMFMESYLYIHFTTLLCVIFSSFLYKNYREINQK